MNSPETIDSGYRDYVYVASINLGPDPFTVNPGDRIALMIVAPYARTSYYGVGALAESERGENGLGSTGV